MKRFLLKILLYLVPILLLHVFWGFYADGNTDGAYVKFTSCPQQNIILGTSRAAQGVVPSVLEKNFNTPFYNYAFTLMHSPYGDTYLNALHQKLDNNTHNGIFILVVDPWSISIHRSAKDTFQEKKAYLGNTHYKNIYPNYEYLLKNYYNSWYDLYRYNHKFGKRSIYTNEDGWVEVTLNKEDFKQYHKKEKSKLKDYQNMAEKYLFSSSRYDALTTTISYLKEHGEVYLVRLPQSSKMLAIEDSYMPDFNEKMYALGTLTKTKYFNFMPIGDQVKYTDGNHLLKKSGKYVTQLISDSIKLK